MGPASTDESIDLIVRDMRWEADDVLRLGLERLDGSSLPSWEAGAHIDLVLPVGVERQYSLSSDPSDSSRWEVAVLREAVSRGGSRFIHSELRPGARVQARGPVNTFPLTDAQEYLFVAGGIGITALLPMIEAVARAGKPFRVAYLGRQRARMAYLADPLLQGPRVTVVAADEHERLDLDAWLAAPASGTTVYACGPARLLDTLEAASAKWPGGLLRVERFQPKVFADVADDSLFEVEARRSGLRVTVESTCTILEMLEQAGVPVPSSCLEGVCGTCETTILDGEAEHRDSILAPDERAANETMMICVSRSKLPTLVLDI
ncbi:PDR/VanB family oxidoreductase [Microbacterium sp. zg.Y1090]|uniref:PDR/VanB family oxidoreductase n=1 Tax=Microbacterium wangruii TaxID=3049073 RepID=UPI00214AFA5D|nr:MULTISPECIES: PDR/VanB family oxidoreductase [unclassified Microbacterium]MCR2817411.1 PDR/VanB family oxidoreductase [Microbacterium sp. zg.Y1090]WIM29103.1 PDR/VanB family oxidoreductase [Microbacterium sp. zg-Y1090]